jgi:hypothetical protein
VSAISCSDAQHIPPRWPFTSDCPDFTGHGQGIPLTAGGEADFVCAGDTALTSWPALAYASAITAGSLLRESTPSDIDCRNRQDARALLACAAGAPAALRAQREDGIQPLRRDLCGRASMHYRRPSRWATNSPVARGCSAVGSASPCQGEGRGFESRHPLDGADASTPAVEWPSGEATACKAVHTGSIPVSTSEIDPARLAQRESASLTRKRSLVQSQYRAPVSLQVRGGF